MVVNVSASLLDPLFLKTSTYYGVYFFQAGCINFTASIIIATVHDVQTVSVQSVRLFWIVDLQKHYENHK